MKLPMRITEVKALVSKGLTAKMLGGLALGAILMTAAALPFATTHADEPSRPMVSEKMVIDRGNVNTPDDAWMFDAPFYETFLEVSIAEVQSNPGDAWVFHSPFYETYLEVPRAEVQHTPDDAWIFDAPFYEDLGA